MKNNSIVEFSNKSNILLLNLTVIYFLLFLLFVIYGFIFLWSGLLFSFFIVSIQMFIILFAYIRFTPKVVFSNDSINIYCVLFIKYQFNIKGLEKFKQYVIIEEISIFDFGKSY